ncbi:hypothetical protein [Gordonia sp. MP11Mi]|uniref:Uncharacterized protein n=1 Tax=Gordonia sp. MP11Mi TaxID=3022769 RepID=A0AA97CUF3_9ACTN
MKRDIIAAAASLGALLIVDARWPFWVVWAVAVAYQISKYKRGARA